MIENKDWLYHEFIELSKSLPQIAKEQKTTEDKVRYWQRKFGLKAKQRKKESKIKKICKECKNFFIINLGHFYW